MPHRVSDCSPHSGNRTECRNQPTVERLLALVSILRIGYDEVAPFQIVEHLCQSATTITCGLLYLTSQEPLSLGSQQADDVDISVCFPEQCTVQLFKLVAQVTAPTEYQGIDILWQAKAGA